MLCFPSQTKYQVREKAIQKLLADNLETIVVIKTLYAPRESANVTLDTTPKKDNAVS